jgi:ribosomal protein L3 glutamine methyltransferase
MIAADTARTLIFWAEQQFADAGVFYGHGTTNALDEAVFLVFAALGLEYHCADALLDAPCTPEQAQRARAFVHTRIETRKPAPYVAGEAWFAGLRFKVDERVLIPRSPIAELIESGFEPWVRSSSVGRVLDLCTGSGCIAIGCALALPHARVDAVDISADALAVAGDNVQRHGVAETVELIRSDLFGQLPARRYDLIVSNPPYVPQDKIDELPAEYRHEPRLGLAAGADGLDLVERILRDCLPYLTRNGVLLVEVGDREELLQERYPHVPFTWVEFERGGDGVFLLNMPDVQACFGT